MFSETLNMTFSHVNPTTNKVWSRDELHTALKVEQARNSGLISVDQYLADISARWDIHTVECRQAFVDTLNAGKWTRRQFNRLLA